MTKLDIWREKQRDLTQAKDRGNMKQYLSDVRREVLTRSAFSPWTQGIAHAFVETWNEEFETLWKKLTAKLQADVEQARAEARAEAEEIIEETEPIAYG